MSIAFDITSTSTIGLERDHNRIALLTTLGSLADGVLYDLIALDSDLPLEAGPQAIRRAAGLFRDAADRSARPANIWDAPSVTDELFLFSSSVAPSSDIPTSHDGLEIWAREIADTLDRILEAATPADVEFATSTFRSIARSTLQQANDLSGTRNF